MTIIRKTISDTDNIICDINDKIIVIDDIYKIITDHTTLNTSNNSELIFTDLVNKYHANTKDDITEGWLIFKNFMRLKISLTDTITNIMKNLNLDVIIKDIGSYSLIRNLRSTNLLPVPDIIQLFGLTNMYEQLIIYEYIYMSSKLTLTEKMVILIMNDCDQLLELLEKNHLEVSINNNNIDIDIIVDESINLRHKIYNDDKKLSLFNRFVTIHSNWLGISLDDIDDNDDRSIILANMTKSNTTYDNDSDPDSETLMRASHTLNIINKNIPFKISELCHLNRLYKITNKHMINSDRFNKILTNVINNLDNTTAKINMNDTKIYKLYLGADLIIQMMENNDDNIRRCNNLTKRRLEKIFSVWLWAIPNVISYITSYSIPNFDINHVLRKITLSPMILDILKNIKLTYYEMKYIYMADHDDMFKIICKDRPFNVINDAIHNYFPNKIFNHISEVRKTLKYVAEIHDLEFPNLIRANISLNVKNLVGRSNDELIDTLNKFNTTYTEEPIIELVDNNDDKRFIEHLYISKYWGYMNMIDTYPESVLCFLTILNWITNKSNLKNYQLECVILKTVLEHPKYQHNIHNTYDMINSLMNQIMANIITDNNFITKGIDYNDIKDELRIIGVTTTKTIDHLETIYSSLVDIDEIE